jgi:hypothetical protein
MRASLYSTARHQHAPALRSIIRKNTALEETPGQSCAAADPHCFCGSSPPPPPPADTQTSTRAQSRAQHADTHLHTSNNTRTAEADLR